MRSLILGAVIAAGLGFAGLAQTPEQQIVDSLEAQGYHLVTRDWTWLGRIWIVVENGDLRREIVFNPSTGEILRDYSVMLVAEKPKADKSDSKSSGATASVAAIEAPIDATVSMDAVVGAPLVVIPAPDQ